MVPVEPEHPASGEAALPLPPLLPGQRRRCLSEGLEHERLIETMIRRCGQFLDDRPALTVVGIRTRGVAYALHARNRLAMAKGLPGRDAVHFAVFHPPARPPEAPAAGHLVPLPGHSFDVEGRHVVLIDDVIRTGRTAAAALVALLALGRPASLRLGCLVDAGGREVPLQPDAVGLEVALGPHDRLHVLARKIDGAAGIFLDVPLGEPDRAVSEHPGGAPRDILDTPVARSPSHPADGAQPS